MAVSVFIARRIDAGLFAHVHDGVFDTTPDPHLLESFLAADHLHIAVAVDRDLMVGMACGVVSHYPDQAPSLWITRLRVAPPWRRQGVGTRLVMTMMDHALRLGCDRVCAMADPDSGPDTGPDTDDSPLNAAAIDAFWTRLRWSPSATRPILFSCPL